MTANLPKTIGSVDSQGKVENMKRGKKEKSKMMKVCKSVVFRPNIIYVSRMPCGRDVSISEVKKVICNDGFFFFTSPTKLEGRDLDLEDVIFKTKRVIAFNSNPIPYDNLATTVANLRTQLEVLQGLIDDYGEKQASMTVTADVGDARVLRSFIRFMCK